MAFRRQRIYIRTVQYAAHLKVVNTWVKSAAKSCAGVTATATTTHSVVSLVSYVPNNLRYESADFARSSLRYNKPFNSCNTTAPYGDLQYVDTATGSKGQL